MVHSEDFGIVLESTSGVDETDTLHVAPGLRREHDGPDGEGASTSAHKDENVQTSEQPVAAELSLEELQAQLNSL